MDELDTVGKYGTISLIRKNTLEAITSYPVDDERTTFGRDPKCSIRMYFHAVDPLHCTLYFEDGKAYLEVLGSGGVTVDDALVPAGSTVALNNASKLMIWRKLFLFNYPPREIRSKLMTSPRKANSKSLRMSMIHSAVILTPRADRHQTLDLRTLRSPIKPYREAPNEVVTFVDSDQIAVVEDNGPPLLAAGSFLETEEEEDRSLVALEEIDYDENAAEDSAFSRTPVKRMPTTNPFISSQQQPSTPFRALTPTLQRRSSAHLHVPPLSSIKSPVPTFLPPSASPSAPRLLSPGRPLQSSSLVPRDQWRQAAVGFTPQPPRTPPRRKATRMSMHKAVLVRSAHRVMMAAAKDREDKEEEDEVEVVVSPERKAVPLDFGGVAEEGGDDDAEGEDDYEMREGQGREGHDESEEQSSSGPTSGVLQAGVSLFSSLSTFVRKSLSPERKAPNEATPPGSIDQAQEEGEITDSAPAFTFACEPDTADDSASNITAHPQREPIFTFNLGSAPEEGKTSVGLITSLPPQRSPVRPGFRFNFAPFPALGTTREEVTSAEESTSKGSEEDITDAQDAQSLATPVPPVTRQNSNPFYTPQLSRVLPLQTNTVARPQAALFDGEMPKLNTFLSKPIRPRKSVDLSASALQSMRPVTAPKIPRPEPEDELGGEEDENTRKEREVRAQRRKSLLAAMDATPRHLADPSARRSTVLPSALKRREGSLVPGSPTKKVQFGPFVPTTSHQIDDGSTFGQPHLTIASQQTLVDLTEIKDEYTKIVTPQLLLEEESDVSSALEEVAEPAVDSLDLLKANVDRARRESVVRAARLSHGGGRLSDLGHRQAGSDMSDSTETEGTQPLDLETLLSTGRAELPMHASISSTNSTDTSGVIEVDITEAQTEVVEIQTNVPTPFNVAEEAVEQATADASQDVPSTRTTTRTPSPSKRTVAESPTRTTRGTKRGAAIEADSSQAVKRSTRRRVHETQDDESKELDPEEAPRPLRRGRSATPAAQTAPEDLEPAAPTPSTRMTRRAASETPQSASRSPSKGRAARGRVPPEPVIEEDPVAEAAPPVPKATMSAKPSKIAKSKAVLARPPSRTDKEGEPVRRVTKAKATATASATTSAKPGQSSTTEPSTRVAATVPRARTTSTTTSTTIPSKRTAGDTGRVASGNAGTRVKRSTRPDPDGDEVDGEDSNPRKRRKAVPAVKEEETDDVPIPNGPAARKTSASRLPSALPTASRRVPTATRKTPSNRKGSADHDKENTPETVQPEGQATGKVSVGKGKTAKIPATTSRSRSTAPSTQQEVAAPSSGRSLRERPKK